MFPKKFITRKKWTLYLKMKILKISYFARGGILFFGKIYKMNGETWFFRTKQSCQTRSLKVIRNLKGHFLYENHQLYHQEPWKNCDQLKKMLWLVIFYQIRSKLAEMIKITQKSSKYIRYFKTRTYVKNIHRHSKFETNWKIVQAIMPYCSLIALDWGTTFTTFPAFLRFQPKESLTNLTRRSLALFQHAALQDGPARLFPAVTSLSCPWPH